jgi:FkbM family methyltransferase
MNMLQGIKDRLVALGVHHPAVKFALKLHARRRGFRLAFTGSAISLAYGKSKMLLDQRQFTLVPSMIESYADFFRWIEPEVVEGCDVLDFSVPRLHSYRGGGMSFYFPGIPEDDSIEAYTHWCTPQPGDLVFDVGAHAGFTTYSLSRMVGTAGRVIAFEPDDTSYTYLCKNIQLHHLQNVVAVKKAMAGATGTAIFNMDGTMAAGLSEYLVYETGKQVRVETISFPDACREFGVPALLKMDIEGAELELVRSSLSFLAEHPVNLAVESYHRLHDGSYTWKLLEDLLRSIPYHVESSPKFGLMFTWARPQSVDVPVPAGFPNRPCKEVLTND